MKSKKILFLIPLATTILFSQPTGEEIFDKNCAECHATVLGVTHDGGYDNSFISPAPYIDDLVKKLKKKTVTAEKFREFIKEYIENPDKRKSLYGKKAIKKFGLMPSLKDALTQDEIIQLSNYLYEKSEE